jgi:hypothetical protein
VAQTALSCFTRECAWFAPINQGTALAWVSEVEPPKRLLAINKKGIVT